MNPEGIAPHPVFRVRDTGLLGAVALATHFTFYFVANPFFFPAVVVSFCSSSATL